MGTSLQAKLKSKKDVLTWLLFVFLHVYHILSSFWETFLADLQFWPVWPCRSLLTERLLPETVCSSGFYSRCRLWLETLFLPLICNRVNLERKRLESSWLFLSRVLLSMQNAKWRVNWWTSYVTGSEDGSVGKGSATKPGSLISAPRALPRKWKERIDIPALSSDRHVCTMAHVPTCITLSHMVIMNKEKI